MTMPVDTVGGGAGIRFVRAYAKGGVFSFEQ
jgi:hypothetical protein